MDKPKHLGVEYASQFKDRSMVDAYRFRPPYPDETFDLLTVLVQDAPRVLLDVGCGRGEIARPMASRLDRVDAVDFSEEMIRQGKELPGGDNPRLTWIHGMAESVQLSPHYALITAGQSLHWMDWEVLLPRFASALTPGGNLAIVELEYAPKPWDAELGEIIRRYSTNRDYKPYNLIAELEKRALFRKKGEVSTLYVEFVQPVAGYKEAFHSRNGFSRERMTPQAAADFDIATERLLTPFSDADQLRLQVSSRITWGQPARGL